MEIQISAKDFSLTEALRRRVTQRFDRLMKFRKDIIGATVTLAIESHHTKGEKYCAEARVMIPGNDVFARERATDMLLAIDRVAEKIARQLQKGKERQKERKQKSAL